MKESLFFAHARSINKTPRFTVTDPAICLRSIYLVISARARGTLGKRVILPIERDAPAGHIIQKRDIFVKNGTSGRSSLFPRFTAVTRERASGRDYDGRRNY